MNVRARIASMLPPRARALARRAAALPRLLRCEALDLAERVSGRAEPLTPPRRMWELVGGRDADFRAAGEGLLGELVGRGLAPSHDVLEIGSGIGRLAVPLTRYLAPSAVYVGADILREGVDWCKKTITPRHPNFRFLLLDVKNDRYNPSGSVPARDYQFPLPDKSFDYVFLGSVFTHMYLEDVAAYVAEIARLMRPGGRCVASFYLMDEARRAALAPDAAFRFAHAIGASWCARADLPEAAIAHDRGRVLALHEASGLAVEEVALGAWDQSPNQSQDILVTRRL